MLNSDRDDLSCVVARIVAESKIFGGRDAWATFPTPVAAVRGRILVGAVPDMPSAPSPTLPSIDRAVSFVIVSADTSLSVSSPGSDTDSDATDDVPEESHVLRLRLAEGKKDQLHFLQHVLPVSIRYIKARLAAGDAICVCCDSGRDVSVGVALAAIQLCFDDDGRFVEPGVLGPFSVFFEIEDITLIVCCVAASPSKESIRTRLQWIIASRPAANPSRVTLKRVNEFLLSSPAFRRR